MESVTEVPEEASGLRKPRFWIRVFLLLDTLPAKANEPCLPPSERSKIQNNDKSSQTEGQGQKKSQMRGHRDGHDD